jgi:serine/threonine-protein kinase
MLKFFISILYKINEKIAGLAKASPLTKLFCKYFKGFITFNYISAMKKPPKKFWKKVLYVVTALVIFLFVLDYILLPIYVKGSETNVPSVVGKQKDEAIKILQDAGLNPIVQTSRFDVNYKKDHVIFQKPVSDNIVKKGRRIYLTISGGEQYFKMPLLIGKTIRDTRVTLERIGFILGKIDSVESEFPADNVVEQQYPEGQEIPNGTVINVKVSIGPQVGMIRVPNILGKSLIEAENILKSNSIKLGNKTYIYSLSLLPNTVVDQQPSESTLIKIGDSVNVIISQSKIK